MSARYKYRYQLAEEILRAGDSDQETHNRILEEFPDSKENPTRAQWYRRSWNKYGHCRGDHAVASVSMASIEKEWLNYAWSVLNDHEHIRQCEQNGGTGIEDPSLRWPGYLGEQYKTGGLLLVANIHTNFASGGAKNADLANRLVACTRKWRDSGRGKKSDREYLTTNRECYVEGLQKWTVGKWFSKFLDLIGLQFEDVTYLNAARCQSLVGTCQSLQRLCLSRFPLQNLETVLQPRLVLTTSIVVRNEVRLSAPVRWFNQRNGLDQNDTRFCEWSKSALDELQREPSQG